MKPAPLSACPNGPLLSFNHGVPEYSFGREDQTARGLRWWRCPYGQPGDKLWVREAFADVNTSSGPGIGYRADGGFYQPEYDGPDYGGGPSYDYDKYPGRYTMWFDDLMAGAPDHKWRPSIHMPRWASRLTLEVTDVRVQRLQDISEEDARAEGVECDSDGWRDYLMPATQCAPTASDSYLTLWNSLHGEGAWAANPWVWAVSFTPLYAEGK
jgi:hypothetical protein